MAAKGQSPIQLRRIAVPYHYIHSVDTAFTDRRTSANQRGPFLDGFRTSLHNEVRHRSFTQVDMHISRCRQHQTIEFFDQSHSCFLVRIAIEFLEFCTGFVLSLCCPRSCWKEKERSGATSAPRAALQPHPLILRSVSPVWTHPQRP